MIINILKYSCLLILTLTITGCDAISEKLGFSQPEIVSVYPGRFMSGVSPDVEIIVEFSDAMDTVKTNQAFALSTETGTIQGYFRWDGAGTTMTFTPKEPLSDSNMYTISITTDAEDSDGNDLKENYESVFYVNSDLTPPTIVSHTPDSGATGVHPSPEIDPILYASSFIRITFSEAMDIDSIFDGFSISPSVQGLFSWNVNHTEVTFDPVYDLDYGTTYIVSLGTSLRDLNGNNLEEQYNYSFTVGDDFTGPELTSVNQEKGGISGAIWSEGSENLLAESRWDIILTFNEPVLRKTISNSISLSPSANFHIEAPTTSSTIRIKLDEPLESECHYTLKITPSITDPFGNSLVREYRYKFYTNGAESTCPVVEYITDTDHGYPPYNYPPADYWAHDDIEPLSFNDPYGDVYIIFNKEIDPVSIGVDITRSFGSGGGIPSITSIDWPVINPPGQFRVYKFQVTGLVPGNTYRMNVNGGSTGLKDSYGNIMKEDYIQYFKVPLP
jgi:hypothetical protein